MRRQIFGRFSADLRQICGRSSTQLMRSWRRSWGSWHVPCQAAGPYPPYPVRPTFSKTMRATPPSTKISMTPQAPTVSRTTTLPCPESHQRIDFDRSGHWSLRLHYIYIIDSYAVAFNCCIRSRPLRLYAPMRLYATFSSHDHATQPNGAAFLRP